MDQGWGRALWYVFCQPAGKGLYLGNVVCLSAEVAFDPALYLAGKKTFGMPKFAQSRSLPVNSVYLYKSLDNR